MSHRAPSPLMPPRPAPASEWFVIIETGSLAGQRFPLRRAAAVLTLGRDPSCAIQFDPLHERMVGRRHAHIELRSDGLYLIDDSSANGTFKDGQAVSQVRLQHGDRFQLGGEVEGAQGPWLSIHMSMATHFVPPRSEAVTLLTQHPAARPSPAPREAEPAASFATTATVYHAAPPAAAALITPLLGLSPVALGDRGKTTAAADRYEQTSLVSAPSARGLPLSQRRKQLLRQVAGIALLVLLACTVGVMLGLRARGRS